MRRSQVLLQHYSCIWNHRSHSWTHHCCSRHRLSLNCGICIFTFVLICTVCVLLRTLSLICNCQTIRLKQSRCADLTCSCYPINITIRNPAAADTTSHWEGSDPPHSRTLMQSCDRFRLIHYSPLLTFKTPACCWLIHQEMELRVDHQTLIYCTKSDPTSNN